MHITLLIFFFCINCAQCANILIVAVFPSFSHQIVFQPIWRELSLRGHKVTAITPNPLNDPSLTNLTEISMSFINDIWKTKDLAEILPREVNDFQKIDSAYRFMEFVIENELNSTQFQKLIRDKNEKFDLVLMECHYPVLYALTKRFNAPMVCISSFGVMTSLHEAIGNPNQPVLYPDLLLTTHSDKMSLWQKIKNFLFGLCVLYYHKYVLIPRHHKISKKNFGNNISYIGNLENEISMIYLNEDLLLSYPRPYVPAILQMNQMHLRPVKPLPKDLQQFLDEASEGVIYFSLGTNVKSVNLDTNLRKIIIDALSELPYKVIWKWESDHLPEKPPNVITRKWLPQQDILGHSNIRVFVTQGGLQSVQEAISRAVPLVGLPFICDQDMNVQKIVKMGIGVSLDPSTLTKEKLKKSITEVIQNGSYKKRINIIKNIFEDHPIDNIDEVIWWCEYIIRHKGAKHLRSFSADMSWFEFFMLDVIFIFNMIVIVVLFACYIIYSYLK